MKLAIMFCNYPEIEIRDIPDYYEKSENFEDYIRDELGYNVDELSWQTYDCDEVKVNVL